MSLLILYCLYQMVILSALTGFIDRRGTVQLFSSVRGPSGESISGRNQSMCFSDAMGARG
jgi:hypothetical protein